MFNNYFLQKFVLYVFHFLFPDNAFSETFNADTIYSKCSTLDSIQIKHAKNEQFVFKIC